MKIYGVFLFGYELDLLEIRLNLLDPYVDYFVFSESKWEFSGIDKGLNYESNKDRFEKLSHKIIYNQIPDPIEEQLKGISAISMPIQSDFLKPKQFAGEISGASSSGSTHGVAYEADIYAIKMFCFFKR